MYVCVCVCMFVFVFVFVCVGVCWNSNSNTLYLLCTPNAQEVRWQIKILRTECIQRVSESLFSFYIDYPSQK